MFSNTDNYPSGHKVADLTGLPIKHVYKLLSYYHNQGLLSRKRVKLSDDGVAKVWGWKISKNGGKKLKYLEK